MPFLLCTSGKWLTLYSTGLTLPNTIGKQSESLLLSRRRKGLAFKVYVSCRELYGVEGHQLRKSTSAIFQSMLLEFLIRAMTGARFRCYCEIDRTIRIFTHLRDRDTIRRTADKSGQTSIRQDLGVELAMFFWLWLWSYESFSLNCFCFGLTHAFLVLLYIKTS